MFLLGTFTVIYISDNTEWQCFPQNELSDYLKLNKSISSEFPKSRVGVFTKSPKSIIKTVKIIELFFHTFIMKPRLFDKSPFSYFNKSFRGPNSEHLNN